MEKSDKKVGIKKEQSKKPVKLTCLQICNELKIISYDRVVMEQKFGDKVLTVEEWDRKLKEIKFNF